MLLVRFSLVVCIFIFLVTLYKSSWIGFKESGQQIIIGALIHGAYLGGVFFAINEGIAAGVAAVIVGLQPLVTSFIGKVFLNQPLNIKQAIGLTLGFLGISLVILEKIDIAATQFSFSGLLACIIALFSISIGTVLQKHLASKTPLLTGSFYQYIGAIMVVSLLSFNLEDQQFTLTWELAIAMTWLIFGLSVLAILLLLYMIREGEVAKVTSYFYLVPPVALFQTWLIFDEKLGIMAMTGTLLTILAVIMVVKYQSDSS